MLMTRRTWIAAALLAGLVLAAGAYAVREAAAQAKKDELPPDLRRVPRDAALFVTVRPGDLWALPEFRAARDKFLKESPDIVQQIEATFGVPPEDLDRVTFIVTNAAPNTQPAFAVHTARSYARKQVLMKAAPDAKEKKSGDHTLSVPERGYAFHFIDDRSYLVGPVGELETILDKIDRRKEGPLGPALKRAAEKQTLVGALNVAEVRKVLPPDLPKELEPFRSLLETDVATVSLDVGETLRGRADAGFTKDAHAKDSEDAVGAAMTLARLSLPALTKELKKDPKENAALLYLADLGAEALKNGKVSRDGTAVRVEASAKADLAALSQAIETTSQKARQAAQRAVSQNNLKQLGLALHNYHDTHGTFPPAAVYDKAGKPLLSWRVLILPYIEQDALYRQFRLDEPWDSDHNKKLLAQISPVYRRPTAKPGTDTHYRVFTGRGTIFEGKRGSQIAKIADGVSNTILVAEAAEGVPWSKPDELPYDPAKPLPKLGGLFPDGFNVLFADGSVRFIRANPKEKVLRTLITVNDGIPIDINDL